MKLKILIIIISNLLICNFSFSQDITNILGTNGVFTIRDASNNFLTLSQSNGYLSLNRSLVLPQTTSSTTGVVYNGANRFIHNYGTQNTFVGVNSGNFTTTGSYITAMGYLSLSSNTIGYNNSAFGVKTLYSNTTGELNSAFGSFSLNFNTTGYNNSAFGDKSLYSNTTGSWNSAFGSVSLDANTTGYSNSAFGHTSLHRNTTGYNNSAFGVSALTYNTTGYYNSAFGTNALAFNNVGSDNSAFGSHSLYLNTTGFENIGFGSFSLYRNTNGSYNTALGYSSLYLNTTGFQNTAVGHHSLQYNNGNYNTALGYNAGSYVTSGANLTLIGIDANPSSGTVNDQVTLGNGYVTSLRCNVQTITSLSDIRDKKNITELSLGLDFIAKLHPRQFNWDKREWYDNNVSDGSKMKELPTAGFIAQELDEAQTTAGVEWLNLVLKDNPEKWEATYGNLLPVMVKAIQELKAENDELKNKNEVLEERLAKYEQLQNTILKKMEQLESKENDTKEIKLGEK